LHCFELNRELMNVQLEKETDELDQVQIYYGSGSVTHTVSQ